MNKWMLIPAITAVLTVGGVALAKDAPVSSESMKARNLLTEDQAIAIAKEKVNGVVVEIELDRDNNYKIYEIELEDGMYEYDMEIDAVTGTILKYSKEHAGNAFDETPKNFLTKDEAITIAKTVGKGIVVKFELDDDDDRVVYEIDMKDDHFEYDIMIDAKTGEVIEFEKERFRKETKQTSIKVGNETSKVAGKAVNNLSVVEKKNSEPAVKVELPKKVKTNEQVAKRSKLSTEQVIAIAKSKAAGVVTDIELDGKVYEVEIDNGDDEYDLEIDAFTGEILSFGKD